MCMVSMEKSVLFKSIGFSEVGTTETLNIVSENSNVDLEIVLKTASGFGGGNAALLLKQVK